jgi:hypothetical protein
MHVTVHMTHALFKEQGNSIEAFQAAPQSGNFR